jgi:hypothetical protein
MKDIHTAWTLADAYVVRDALLRAGIQASIRNEHLIGSTGGIPIQDTAPRVAVGDADVDRARVVLAEIQGAGEGARALEDMEGGDTSSPDGADAQTAMTDLFQAAGDVLRGVHHGSDIDQIQRLGAIVAATPAPFGIDPDAWVKIGRLAAQIVAAADNQAQAGERAAELREILGAYV